MKARKFAYFIENGNGKSCALPTLCLSLIPRKHRHYPKFVDYIVQRFVERTTWEIEGF